MIHLTKGTLKSFCSKTIPSIVCFYKTETEKTIRKELTREIQNARRPYPEVRVLLTSITEFETTVNNKHGKLENDDVVTVVQWMVVRKTKDTNYEELKNIFKEVHDVNVKTGKIKQKTENLQSNTQKNKRPLYKVTSHPYGTMKKNIKIPKNIHLENRSIYTTLIQNYPQKVINIPSIHPLQISNASNSTINFNDLESAGFLASPHVSVPPFPQKIDVQSSQQLKCLQSLKVIKNSSPYKTTKNILDVSELPEVYGENFNAHLAIYYPRYKRC